MPLPKVVKASTSKRDEQTAFPVSHYSASSMIRFSTNPILFKIEYVNGDRFDTGQNIASIVGKAFHKAMETYYGGNDEFPITSEAEAIECGLKVGMAFLEGYNDTFINYSKTIPTKQKALDLLSFAFSEYIKVKPYSQKGVELVSTEEEMLEKIDVDWRGQRLTLPVQLKGFTDKITREDGKLKITDYKTTSRYTDHDRIDGAKIIAAIQYYLLTYAKYGEEPYSITYEEVKLTKNSDGSPQVREYEMVFAENELYFDFYFRFYQDITDALNGKQVYVPNVHTLYDNEVAIIAYIHRLDVSEEQAALMKKHKVDNITDLLKKNIQSAGNMRKLMKSVENQLTEAKNINYTKMTNQEKIQTKMLEHGMVLQFVDKLEGASVDLYRYVPTIGLRMKRLNQYVADVEQVLATSGVRILAPIPDTDMVGFEVPRKERTFPHTPSGKGFDIAIGETVMGEPRRFDIREAPHILVAGSSGSGKSIWISSLITQLNQLAKNKMEIHLFDPKVVELAHHSADKNVVEYKTDIMDIYDSLQNLVGEMNRRYTVLASAKVRSIDQYDGKMPYKVVIVDESGDLIMQDYVHEKTILTGEIYTRGQHAGEDKVRVEKTEVSKEISKFILLLAQKARAAGIHIVISTQRPSTDIITGTIKANFPTKVLLRTAKAVDSQVVIDEHGGEKLLGKGDMIFAGDRGLERLQGYLSDY